VLRELIPYESPRLLLRGKAAAFHGFALVGKTAKRVPRGLMVLVLAYSQFFHASSFPQGHDEELAGRFI
jgi:DNA-binding LytR/AlgR family response regulator